MNKLIDKLFLIKEIISKKGILHFRRYRIISLKWFNIYIHKIYESDKDDCHDHPWNFFSLILWGSYEEIFPDNTSKIRRFLNFSYYPATHAHKIKAIKTCATFVITGREVRPLWGYIKKDGWISHLQYREIDKKIKDHD